MKPKISLLTLGVRDMARSLAFYRDGLGLPTHNYEEGADVAFFALEGTWLAIHPREKLAEDAQIPAEGHGFSGVTIAHNEQSKERSTRCMRVRSPPGRRWSRNRKTSSGAAIPAISPIPTVICGKWPSTLSPI
jgi:catechol 2,3-dioxygenase-like lactoylglutathione lyase family enzyme